MPLESTAHNNPVTVIMFSDYVCPWCYLGNAVIENLVTRGLVNLQRLPFPLHPATPTDGLLLSDLLRGVDLDAVHQRLYTLMDELGLPHGARERTYNSRLAQELGMWADTQPGGAALHRLLFTAYFAEDRNLAQPAVLLNVAAQAGLDTAAATKVLTERSFSEAVDQAWQQARALQINGVPAFIARGYQVAGFQPEAEMERFLDYVRNAQDTESAPH